MNFMIVVGANNADVRDKIRKLEKTGKWKGLYSEDGDGINISNNNFSVLESAEKNADIPENVIESIREKLINFLHEPEFIAGAI